MTLLRRFLILVLMPMTVWGAMPQVACQCSDGKVLLNCPRLANRLAGKTDGASCSQAKNCCRCGGGQCHQKTEADDQHQKACCADSCRCTPVVLDGKSSPTVKKVSLSESAQWVVASLPPVVVRIPRIVPVQFDRTQIDQRTPDDLIILCERWLI